MRALSRIYAKFGTLVVLFLLCGYFSWATFRDEPVEGRSGGEALATRIASMSPASKRVAIVAPAGPETDVFVTALAERLKSSNLLASEPIVGDPPTVREALEKLASSGGVDLIATTRAAKGWPLFDSVRSSIPALARVEVVAPEAVRRSAFLSPSNLRNVADQISVIALIAIGMTMVVITGGIDLSVGSLVALSAVLAAWIIQRQGGESAGLGVMVGAGAVATVACGGVGLFSAGMVTRFRIPPFIATLAMMQVASGLAFILARGETIYSVPASITGLGRGAWLAGIPNAVILMLGLYAVAHVVMTRTATGRHMYAVGANAEAARLSGVNVARTKIVAYVVSGLAAGIGGVITASQLKAGAPTYGALYELYVIAAVVVGGTSLSGGEGRIFGTLVGALIIAVIRNGMNLTGVEPYTQKVVLGLVILAAVLLDKMKPRVEA
jgi:ribose transport system permease protein